VTNTTQRSAEMDFHNKRDQEIKAALAKHYADAQLVNLEISNKLARRNMWAAWVAVFVGIASLAIVIGIFYVSNWVIHHG
jgi:type IV secretory pathway component VirB8